MHRILLTCTALLTLAAPSAHAEMNVTVGGFTAFQAGIFDDGETDSSSRDFQSEAEIFLRADGTADNGLNYGAKVLLNTSTSDTANAKETFIYLAGGWGRVELGDLNGASELNVFAPTVGIGQINGSYDDFVSCNACPVPYSDRGDHSFTAFDSLRATKVNYYTPKLAGFQAGVSYVPELSFGESVEFTPTLLTDIFELGLKYEGEFSGVGVTLGGGYNFGDTPAGFENLSAWSAGAQLSYQGFRVGGGYRDDGDSLANIPSTNVRKTGWNLGATYERGPWGFGASYLYKDFDVNGSTFGNDGGNFDAFVAGFGYVIAPGLTTGVDAAVYERNRAGFLDDENGHLVMMDVTAAF